MNTYSMTQARNQELSYQVFESMNNSFSLAKSRIRSASREHGVSPK